MKIRTSLILGIAVSLFLGLAGGTSPAKAQQVTTSLGPGQDGYYYPVPQTEERYRPRVPLLPGTDRLTRVAFTTGLTQQMLASPSPPRFAIFPKGEDGEKLIIVAVQDGAYNTLYRLRALMAMLTAYARSSPAFENHPHPEKLTFLDLIYLIGFKQITLSDGREIAHRIILDPDTAQ